jgi:hypothetical protein
MTMRWIASQTTTSASQITFDSIPQTFTHLQVRVSGRDASATSVNSAFIVLNGAFADYATHSLFGNGTSAGSTGTTAQVLIPIGVLPGTSASANIVGSIIVDILDYTDTNKNKTIRAIGGSDLNGSGQVSLSSGFRVNTAAVTSITLGGAFTSPYQFASGTTVDLYGITSNPIATGA